MDKLPVDAMQKVLQFVGIKDCVGLAQTSTQLRNDVHKQRFTLFTEIRFNAEHPDWGYEGGCIHMMTKDTAMRKAEELKKNPRVVSINVIQLYAPIGFIANTPTFKYHWSRF